MRLEAKRRRIDEGPKAFSSAPVPTAHIALPAHTLAHPVPNPPPAAHPSHAPPYSSASVPDRPRPVLPPPHANGNPTNGPHAQQPYHDQQHAPQLYQAQSSNQPYQNQQQHQPYQPQPQSQQNRPPGANQSGPAPQQTAYSSQPGPVRPPADVPTHSPAQQHHVQASSHVPSATTHVSYPSANQHTPSTASYSAPAPRLHTSVSAAHAPAAIVAPVHSNGQSPVPPPAGEPERPTQ